VSGRADQVRRRRSLSTPSHGEALTSASTGPAPLATNPPGKERAAVAALVEKRTKR